MYCLVTTVLPGPQVFHLDDVDWDEELWEDDEDDEWETDEDEE